MPSKYTPDTVDTILRALREGCTRKGSAGIARISEASLYSWMTLYPEFAEAVENAQGEYLAKVGRLVSGHPMSALKWAKHLFREDPQLEPVEERLSLSGNVGYTLQVRVLAPGEVPAALDPPTVVARVLPTVGAVGGSAEPSPLPLPDIPALPAPLPALPAPPAGPPGVAGEPVPGPQGPGVAVLPAMVD